MFSAGNIALRSADRFRSGALQLTMRSPWLRGIYLDRARRLSLLTLGTMALNLVLAVFFPLWMLAFSPVFWGLPHLVASLRYSVRPSNSSRALMALGLLSAILVSLRVWGDFSHVPSWWFYDRRLEFAGLIVAGLILAVSFRAPISQTLLGLVRLAPLFAAAALYPRLTLGILLFGHHFVAFFMWHNAASSARDKKHIQFLLLCFALAHALIFIGFFDNLFFLFPSFMELSFADLSLGAVGQSIFGEAITAPIIWCRLAVAFAFGQSVHYFIWLRAIPEQHLPNATPTNFRQSLHWLQRDFGARGAQLAILFTLAGSAFWLLLEFPMARIAYISVAAFHGFLELAALGLGKVKAPA